MCLNVLLDVHFFFTLFAIDLAWAKEAGNRQCSFCGGPLHQANYRRKPRGGPAGHGEDLCIRFSYCCGRVGCRKRFTPPSVRFMSRKVYFGVVVLLQPRDMHVPDRTLSRWRVWWREHVAKSSFWKHAKGLLNPPTSSEVSTDNSPNSPIDPPSILLSRFSGSLSNRLRSTLKFLCPISTYAQFCATDYLRLPLSTQKMVIA